jgi:NSS family neurotransmitter:Na+ symporter
MAAKAQFGSKIGLIAATVGSAVGLGNVWRFPAEAQANGGAAFLLLYIACVFILGIPVMLAEFTLGRGQRSDAVGVFKRLSPKSYWWIGGAIAILASYLILSFYMVVAGWTLEYFWQSLTGALYSSASLPTDSCETLDAQFAAKMKEYILSDIRPLVMTYVMLAINLGILLLGVKKGIEKMSNVLMPVLFILLLTFAGVALTLPKAAEGLQFFLSPDFSKITPSVVMNALGQSFFSLSLGMGILITYSSYFPKETRLTRTAVTVSLLDMLVAVMMGFIIFPAVKSFGLDHEGLEGATLVFVTLPEVFAQMPMSQLWSSLFFLLLMVAALTSTISLAEVSIAFMQERFNMRRTAACLTVILPLYALSAICSLSQSSLSWIQIAGMNIFNLLDTVATNIMLPIASIITCVYLGWFAPKGFMRSELTNNGKISVHSYPLVAGIIRYIAPIIIVMILIMSFI